MNNIETGILNNGIYFILIHLRLEIRVVRDF